MQSNTDVASSAAGQILVHAVLLLIIASAFWLATRPTDVVAHFLRQL
jgi:hypothetical protein